jgi:hypothetical protein
MPTTDTAKQPSLPPAFWATAPELEGIRSFLRWLIRLDDPRDPQGVEERRTVTLNQIIGYARDLEPTLDRGVSSLIAAELDQLAYEMDHRPAREQVNAEDIRARRDQLISAESSRGGEGR